MSDTKPQMEPKIVTLSGTGSAEREKRPQSVHSSIRSSQDRGSVETPDKAREGNDEEAAEKEGVIQPHEFEVNTPAKRRNFIQRHLFVILITIIGIVVVGIVVGVLIVKVILHGPKGEFADGWSYVVTTDATGGLHSTELPFGLASFVSTYDQSRPTPTPIPSS